MTTTTKNAPGIRGNGPEGNDTHPTVQVGAEVMTTVPQATDNHPAWCGGCTQHSDGTSTHTGIGYPVSIDGQQGDVVPFILAGQPTVVVKLPDTTDLTPTEARRLARALEVIAAMVEDGAA